MKFRRGHFTRRLCCCGRSPSFSASSPKFPARCSLLDFRSIELTAYTQHPTCFLNIPNLPPNQQIQVRGHHPQHAARLELLRDWDLDLHPALCVIPGLRRCFCALPPRGANVSIEGESRAILLCLRCPFSLVHFPPCAVPGFREFCARVPSSVG